MNTLELQKALQQVRGELVDLSFQVGAGSLKQVHLIRQKRKTLARIQFLLHARENERQGAKRAEDDNQDNA